MRTAYARTCIKFFLAVCTGSAYAQLSRCMDSSTNKRLKDGRWWKRRLLVEEGGIWNTLHWNTPFNDVTANTVVLDSSIADVHAQEAMPGCNYMVHMP